MLCIALFSRTSDAISFLESGVPEPQDTWDCEQLFLEARRFCIGRGKNCEVKIDSQSVSRKHCEIIKITDVLLCVMDNNSTNGIIVDNRKSAYSFLRHGSILEIADCFLVVYDRSIVFRDTFPSQRTLPSA